MQHEAIPFDLSLTPIASHADAENLALSRRKSMQQATSSSLRVVESASSLCSVNNNVRRHNDASRPENALTSGQCMLEAVERRRGNLEQNLSALERARRGRATLDLLEMLGNQTDPNLVERARIRTLVDAAVESRPLFIKVRNQLI
ncbi:unnamed protein product [Protopolystoma xenopodis]|uniref:Uncharacterized protein n=1 Tax=Protopolystoma xenopodis TaxID=117903 RepID=A0A3S5B4H3_9PLAT|nr:unnamed protein product [Protopolystoma xenopodis]